MHSPLERCSKSRPKNMSNLRSFRWHRHLDHTSLVRTRLRNTTYCTIFRCHGVTSAFSRRSDDFYLQSRPKVLPVIQFDYAVAGTHQGQPHFDFMVETDTSTGVAWASAVLRNGKEDPYIVSSILSWLSELGHSKIVQSDGEPASEVVMRMVQSKGAMMKTHRAKSSNSKHSVTATRVTEVPYAIKSKRTKSRLRRTQESPSKTTALYLLGYLGMQHGNTRDSTCDKTQQQHVRRSDTCLTKVQFYLLEEQLHADDQEHWSTSSNQHGFEGI